MVTNVDNQIKAMCHILAQSLSLYASNVILKCSLDPTYYPLLRFGDEFT